MEPVFVLVLLTFFAVTQKMKKENQKSKNLTLHARAQTHTLIHTVTYSWLIHTLFIIPCKCCFAFFPASSQAHPKALANEAGRLPDPVLFCCDGQPISPKILVSLWLTINHSQNRVQQQNSLSCPADTARHLNWSDGIGSIHVVSSVCILYTLHATLITAYRIPHTAFRTVYHAAYRIPHPHIPPQTAYRIHTAKYRYRLHATPLTDF